MSRITGPEIQRLVEAGELVISPFDPNQINPASYNVSIGPEILIYQKMWPLHEYQTLRHQWYTEGEQEYRDEYYQKKLRPCPHSPPDFLEPLDMAVEERVDEMTIPPEGLVLWPGVLYLGCTVEHTETPNHVPELVGRSSTARLNLLIHFTAGYGDPNFQGQWTCELAVMYPLRVYANVPIAQLTYSTIEGKRKDYDGQYQRQKGPQKSGLWQWFTRNRPARNP